MVSLDKDHNEKSPGSTTVSQLRETFAESSSKCSLGSFGEPATLHKISTYCPCLDLPALSIQFSPPPLMQQFKVRQVPIFQTNNEHSPYPPKKKKIRSKSVLTRLQQIVCSSLGKDNICSHIIFQEMLRTKETMIMNWSECNISLQMCVVL